MATTDEFTFVSLDPRPWSAAQSAANSPRRTSGEGMHPPSPHLPHPTAMQQQQQQASSPQDLSDSLMAVRLHGSGSSRAGGGCGTPFSAQDIALLSNRSRTALSTSSPDGRQSTTPSPSGAGRISARPGGPSLLHRTITATSSCMEYESAQPSRAGSPTVLTLQLSTSPAGATSIGHYKKLATSSSIAVGPHDAIATGGVAAGTEQVVLQGHSILVAPGRNHQAQTCLSIRPSSRGAATSDAAFGPDRWQHVFSSGPYAAGLGARAGGQVQGAVDKLLSRYQLSCSMPLALHLRTQKQIAQLKEYHQVREQLKASQATMLSGLGVAQWDAPPPAQDGVPGVSSADLRQVAQRNATNGAGSPSVTRFNSGGIMRDGMYINNDSFAGAMPIKATASASLLFERHTSTADTAPVQRYYLRPDRPSRPRSPPKVTYPTRSPPSGRRLPNGIPVCRLRTEQAARRSAMASTSPTRDSARAAESSGSGGGGWGGSGGGASGGLLTVTHPGNMDQVLSDAMSALGGMPGAGELGEPSKLATPRNAQETSAAAAMLATLGAASSLGTATAEPMLDDPFAAFVKDHFDQLALQQSQRLQKRLNAGLPSLLGSMGVSAHTLGVKH